MLPLSFLNTTTPVSKNAQKAELFGVKVLKYAKFVIQAVPLVAIGPIFVQVATRTSFSNHRLGNVWDLVALIELKWV